KLTLEDIANGVEKKVKVKGKVKAAGVTYKTCGTCNGSGQVMRVQNTILGRMQSSSPCPTCHGSGQILDHKPKDADAEGMITTEETVSIKIPGCFRRNLAKSVRQRKRSSWRKQYSW